MLDGFVIPDWSAEGLLALGFVLLMFGKLVPRVHLEDKDKEVDRWREAYLTEREARLSSDKQTTELLEVAKTTQELIQGVYVTSRQIKRSGDQDASPSSRR